MVLRLSVSRMRRRWPSPRRDVRAPTHWNLGQLCGYIERTVHLQHSYPSSMPGLLRPRTGWAVGRSRVALIVACVAASSAATAAATATTVLSGWVTDTMGGYVAGVTVVLVDAQGKEQRKGRTDK